MKLYVKRKKMFSLGKMRPLIFVVFGLGYLPLHSADVEPKDYLKEQATLTKNTENIKTAKNFKNF